MSAWHESFSWCAELGKETTGVGGHGQTGGITASAATMWGGWGSADWGRLKQNLQSGQMILDLGWLMLAHKKAISVSGPLNRWKDNSPCADLMQCWGPFANPDRERSSRKDMSGKLQNPLMFLGPWKDLYNTFTFWWTFPCFPGQPFLWTCSNKVSLMFNLFFFFWESKSYVWACFAAMLANVRSVSLMQEVGVHGVPLTPRLPGNRVSARGLAPPWRFKPNWLIILIGKLIIRGKLCLFGLSEYLALQ